MLKKLIEDKRDKSWGKHALGLLRVEAVLVGKHGEINEVIQDVVIKIEVDDNKDSEVEHEGDI
jgi:hypothetical protein